MKTQPKPVLGFRVSQTVIIVFIIKGNQVLLATKKTRKYPWRGYGGHLKKNSQGSVKMSIRESAPEYLPGITFETSKLRRVGIVDSFKPDNDTDVPDWATYIYILNHEDCVGDVKPTPEMNTPTWFDVDNLPYDQMVPCYKDFLREMLCGNMIEVEIRYDENHQYIIKRS